MSAPHGRKVEYIGMRIYAQPDGGFRAFCQVKWAFSPDGTRVEDTVIETPPRTTWADAMADGVKLATLLEAAP